MHSPREAASATRGTRYPTGLLPARCAYVELHAHSAYSFLDGASLPEELAARAAELGYDALALTDHDGVYGSLEFAHAAKHFGVRADHRRRGDARRRRSRDAALREPARATRTSAGSSPTRMRDTREPGKERDLLPAGTTIERRRARTPRGSSALSGCARHGLAVVDPKAAERLARAFPGAFYVELQRPYERGDTRRNARLAELAEHARRAHRRHRQRARAPSVAGAAAGRARRDQAPHVARRLRARAAREPRSGAARAAGDARTAACGCRPRTRELADRCTFDLTQELGYRYPDFSDGADPADRQLEEICERAFAERYANANGHKKHARQRLDDELALIARLGLSGFFLLHWEVLELARECALEVRGPGSPRHALPPGRGRGSSVGSIVCYLTGLSHVDPVSAGLSLGRFINDEMVAVPDIDLDFPRDIREKLIVRVTERYGREHAALVATFASYRSRGAIRDVGKALGLPFAELERLARVTDGWDATRVGDELDGVPGTHAGPRWAAFRELTKEIAGLPRHISQHPGGMVISTRPLIDLVPVQPAAMAGRQICQWDKDSCGDAGFLKIDLLGLGMLSAVEDAIDRIARLRGETIDLSRVPLDDPGVYEEIQRADTVGVFQIESRAQMQSLLQTRPENLEDLTVQVALVRPGPIQGKAVHPYVQHRHAKRADPSFEPPVLHESLREPLHDTLGVVVFQDQVLDVAMAAAGFSIGEAEGLRRAMSRKRSLEAIEAWRPRFIAGAQGKGIDDETAHAIYDRLVGFAGFGFPKSHAAAFGLLAYQSAWLRRYYPSEFLCALMNAQPMGFYPPSSLVRDAQRRGVEVRPPHINRSQAECDIEDGRAVRVGLAYVQSVGETEARSVVAGQPYRDLGDLARRASAKHDALEALVAAGACDEWGPRRELLWRLGVTPRGETVGGNRQLALPLEPTAEIPQLPEQTPWEQMLADYKHTSLSVGIHPLQLLRPHLAATVRTTAELASTPNGTRIEVAGMAIARQRPATAKGIVFMLLEDELGQANLIIPSQVYEEHRAIIRGEPLILARGKLERHDRNVNLLVSNVISLGPLARRAASEAEVTRALPRAHHFGHR